MPYCWPAFPGDTEHWTAWHQMYGNSPSLRSVMGDNGDAGKRIWATEFGAPTDGPPGSYVSEGTQAAWSSGPSGSGARSAGRDRCSSIGGGISAWSTAEDFFGLLRHDFKRETCLPGLPPAGVLSRGQAHGPPILLP